jgi:hypothetical protein
LPGRLPGRTLWFVRPSDRPNMPGGDAERSGPRPDQSFLNRDLTGLRMVEQVRPVPGRDRGEARQDQEKIRVEMPGWVRRKNRQKDRPVEGNGGKGRRMGKTGEAPAELGAPGEVIRAGRRRRFPRGTSGSSGVIRKPAWRRRWRVVRWSCREARRAEVACMRQVGASRGRDPAAGIGPGDVYRFSREKVGSGHRAGPINVPLTVI